MKKSPPTPTLTPKQVQPEVIPREPTQSKPHTQTQPRQKVSPQTVVQAPSKPAPLLKVQVTNATPTSVAQPKTVRNGAISSQPVSHTLTAQPATVPQRAAQPTVSSGVIASQPMPQYTGMIRQHEAPKVHASPSRKKPIHVESTTNKAKPRDQVIRNHVTNAPQSMTTPVRQYVNTMPSHVEKKVHAPTTEVMKQHVTNGKSYTAVKHVFSKRARQQASLSLGSPVVQTRTTINYTRQTRKARPATTSRSASSGGFSPKLLAFSKLLREKVARTLTFPRLAKRLGYSGTTHVAIALSKTGIVHDLKVSQPSGYEILDKAAIVTLQKVLETTKPPESIEIEQLVIPIAFNLKRN
ncbi:MAG: TonB family protein [Nitrospira sp. SB0666_bin_27]|nr:TonB family protein [Nitrospira sp. SB0666_bin_27]MYF25277.1 TonB family protein [Nitrospira sp. SB0678_bin_10]